MKKESYIKTMYITITNKIKNIHSFEYEMDGKALSRVNHFKYLGLTISHDLNWKTHIDNICSSAEKKLWYLRRKLKLAPEQTKLTAYLTLVRPTLEYASVVWDPFKNNLIERIEKIQRRAARFILSKYRSTDSVTEMINKLNLPLLTQRRRIARLKILYLIHRNWFNFNAQKYIKQRVSRTVRSSHQEHILPIPARIDVHKYSFFPRTIEEWNSLPHELLTVDNVSKFETGITKLFTATVDT